MRPLTTGSLRGVVALPQTRGQTANSGKKCLFVFLSQIIANSALPVILKLHFDIVVVSGNIALWGCSNLSSGQGCPWNVWIVHMHGMCPVCNILPFSHEVVTAIITVKAGLVDVLQSHESLHGRVECYDLRYPSFIFSLYIHTLNSQLKARSDGHEYDMAIQLLS